MRRSFATPLLLAGALLTGSATSASAYVIDTFDAGDFRIAANTGTANAQQVISALDPNHVLGGQRDLTLTQDSCTAPNGYGFTTAKVYDTTADDHLLFNTSPGTMATLMMEYGKAAALNADLTGGGAYNGLGVEFHFIDGAADVTVDLDGVSVTKSVSSVGMLAFSQSEFTGINFANVNSVKIQIKTTAPSSDFEMSLAAVPVPEPATLTLLGLPLAARLLRSRRVR